MTTLPELREQINKRLTLNLLIQGAAQHAFLTSHYLVRDELNAIEPQLLPLYDKFAAAGFLQYWSGGMVLVMGRPARFWRGAERDVEHPFHHHKLLREHGAALADAARERGKERCREKGVTRVPLLFSIQLTALAGRILKQEKPHQAALVELAQQTTAQVWGIDVARMDAKLTKEVAFGRLRAPRGFRESFLRACAAGYGGVMQRGDELEVVARAWVWPLLSHELVKGTVELICLHGLNELDDRTCAKVLSEADRIGHEPWMLQVAPELWRRLLAVLPDQPAIAGMMMHIARLAPRPLEALMLAVIEKPDWARELLAGLGKPD